MAWFGVPSASFDEEQMRREGSPILLQDGLAAGYVLVVHFQLAVERAFKIIGQPVRRAQRKVRLPVLKLSVAQPQDELGHTPAVVPQRRAAARRRA